MANKKTNKIVQNKKDFAIEVENLSKTFKIPHDKRNSLKGATINLLKRNKYEEFNALKGVSFKVKKGEFFGIIGKNGSGKSTLLKILAGIYTPDSGKIKIDGKVSPFLELGVGFNPELTGRENLYLGGSILGISREEVTRKFNKIVGFAELEEFIDMKLKNYSSGMQVRLAFSLAINVHAEILLMDEVLAVGDSNFQSKCLDQFKKYRDEGKTVLLVSHDIVTVQRYCNRAMLLRDGKIVEIGNAEDVVDYYIKQNMKDMEKLNKKSGSEKKSGSLITKVETYNSVGEKKAVFETGTQMILRIHYKKKLVKKDIFNIGIGLISDDGSYVFGCNTQIDQYEINKKNDYIDLKINNNLLKGLLYVNVVAFSDDERQYYDYVKKAAKFEVFSNGAINKYRGIVHMEHEWV